MIITRFRSLDLKSFVYFACSPNANEALLWLGRVFKGGMWPHPPFYASLSVARIYPERECFMVLFFLRFYIKLV